MQLEAKVRERNIVEIFSNTLNRTPHCWLAGCVALKATPNHDFMIDPKKLNSCDGSSHLTNFFNTFSNQKIINKIVVVLCETTRKKKCTIIMLNKTEQTQKNHDDAMTYSTSSLAVMSICLGRQQRSHFEEQRVKYRGYSKRVRG